MAEAEGSVADADRKSIVPAPSSAASQTGGPPVDQKSARESFLTSIDAEPPARGRQRDGTLANKYTELNQAQAGPRIMEHHQDLTSLALTLKERMDALLAEHEKDFFLAYKTYMYNIQKEIKLLKKKAEDEEEKTRQDVKIKALEKQLDWFMTESLRLDELCKGYKKERDKWKAKADALDEDRRFLEDQIKGAKRQNKILRAAAERARSSAFSALMVTKARTEAKERSLGPGSQELALANQSMAEASRRPRSAGAGGAAGVHAALQLRASTPSTLPHQLALRSPSAGQGDQPRVMTIGHDPSGQSLASAMAGASGGPGRADFKGSGNRSVLGNEAEQRYHEAMTHLKESIAREQHTVRMLQAARSSHYTQKSELEEFFLKCIDESRKDMNRTKHRTLHKKKDEIEQMQELILSDEQVLVSLYEKIFPHRTGIAKSLGPVTNYDSKTTLSQSLAS